MNTWNQGLFVFVFFFIFFFCSDNVNFYLLFYYHYMLISSLDVDPGFQLISDSE